MIQKTRCGRKKCLNCRSKPAKWRGVCQACYSAAKRRILAGEISDEKLVLSGFWLKSQPGPHGPRIFRIKRIAAN